MESLLPEFETFALIHPTCLTTTKHLLQQREYLSKQPLIFEIELDGYYNLMDGDYDPDQELLSISKNFTNSNFKPIIYENNNIENNNNNNNNINLNNNQNNENNNNNNNNNGFQLIKPKAIHLSKTQSNIVTVSIPKVKKDIKKSLKRNNLLSISKMMKNNFYSRTELSSN